MHHACASVTQEKFKRWAFFFQVRVLFMVLFVPVSGESLALNKMAYQIDNEFGAVATRAVDGNHDPDLTRGQSCAHTTSGLDKPWWYVDLGREYCVGSVAITNRNADSKFAMSWVCMVVKSRS